MIELPVIAAFEAQEEAPRTRFWRSISHLRNDPAFHRLVKEEFLPGASEGPGGASRRQFLQLMGASMALAGLTACRRPVDKILPYVRKPEEIIPGIPLSYATSMPFRGSLRGLLVESHEGRPTKVEGNPDASTGRGATSLFEQASILNLYDPDRSQKVLQEGSESTWQDFIDFTQQLAVGAASKRVAVLCEESSSMTLVATREALQARFPLLRWVTYAAEGPDPVVAGMQQAFGQPLRPLYRFSEAQVIVSLDADFLGATDRNSVWNTREYADSRRLQGSQDEMSRLYVAESTYTVTGGMADNRLRLRSSEIPAFAAAVAARLGVPGATGGTFADHPYVVEIARDLQAAGGAGVILAGETQPAVAHALCAAINSRLGSVGQTMLLLDTAVAPETSTLDVLVADMQRSAVDALFIIGCNPAYDAPADLGFTEALRQVGETVHLGLHVDETAAVCRWHLPRAHYLEAWGDGRAYDGTRSIIQPLIAPLYADAHSEIEVVNLLATGLDLSGYDLVRTHWRSTLSGDFEKAWKRVLHDGYLPDTAFPAVSASAGPVTAGGQPTIGADEIEVVFRLDGKVLDGSFANNAWMQELPDATTKMVWDNAALMSPATAEQLGVSVNLVNGKDYVDVVSLTVNGASIELPVWIQPGHADRSITVTLGYGRNLVSKRPDRHTNFFDKDDYTDIYGHGAVANGVGRTVAPLRTRAAMRIATGVQVAKVASDYLIATTQDHGAMPEDIAEVKKRHVFRMATLEEYRANPAFVREGDPEPIKESWEDYPALWQKNHPSDQPAIKDNPYFNNQWGMVIDLNTCTGCNACIVACQAENNIQVVGKEEVSRGREMHWIRLDRYYAGDAENAQMVLQPVPCMHCENAPCESVCPVAATVHSPDGTNQMIYNRCIGTRYCANNCPYKVRRFNFYNWSKTLPTSVKMTQNPNVTVRSRGVMEKCSYCIQRVRAANKRSNLENRPIREGEVVTACQQACPAQAIAFGDLNDPNSGVSQQRKSDRRYEMLAELSVKPRTSYLGRILNPNPRLAASEA